MNGAKVDKYVFGPQSKTAVRSISTVQRDRVRHAPVASALAAKSASRVRACP